MAADTENERRDFTRFNGTNFPQYKFAVVLKLRLFKLEQIVLGTETKPVEVSSIFFSTAVLNENLVFI